MDVPAYRVCHQLEDQKRASVIADFTVDEWKPWLPAARQASYR